MASGGPSIFLTKDMTTTTDLSAEELRKIDSLTKYPSIPTYHELDPKKKGMLIDNEVVEFPPDAHVIGTEKVDGTNGRIIVMPCGDDYFIGSRDELLFARGDRVRNATLGIVAELEPVAEAIIASMDHHRRGERRDAMTVYYFEVYGHRIGGQAKNYSKEGNTGCRLFDICLVCDLYKKLADMSVEAISTWRKNGGQDYFDWSTIRCAAFGLRLPIVPTVFETIAAMPTTLEGMLEALSKSIPESLVALDDAAMKRPEGMVIRTTDRSVIAKVRYEDYERTRRLQQKK